MPYPRNRVVPAAVPQSLWRPFWRSVVLLWVFVLIPVAACYIPTEPTTGSGAKCSTGYCWIRSASVCCPNGYLNYAGAGAGCFATRTACLNAGGGKCWYETSCIP